MPEPTSGATVTLAIAAGVGGAVGSSFINEHSMQWLGVPAIVLVFAVAGAFAAVAYSDPIRPVLRMVVMVLANAFFGILAALALGAASKVWTWADALPPQVPAAVVAFVALWVTPRLIKRLPGAADKALERSGLGPVEDSAKEGKTNA